MASDKIQQFVRDLMIKVAIPDVVYSKRTLYQTMRIHQPVFFESLERWDLILEEILHKSSNASDRSNMNTLFWYFQEQYPYKSYDYDEEKSFEYYMLNPDFDEWKKAHPNHASKRAHDTCEDDSSSSESTSSKRTRTRSTSSESTTRRPS